MTDKQNEEIIKILYQDEFLKKPHNIIKRNELIKKVLQTEQDNKKAS
tara:strand:+ start:286 stop:426 length:141 start_codon:yes stop_codon:yes gene_type:complete